jgi:hypothetical protein
MKNDAGMDTVKGKRVGGEMQLDYKNASILGIHGVIMITSDMDSD